MDVLARRFRTGRHSEERGQWETGRGAGGAGEGMTPDRQAS